MSLEKEHQLFRRAVRHLLNDRVAPYLDQWEADGSLPYRELFPALAEPGYLGISQPSKYGGLGLDHRYTTVWAQELGRLASGSPAMCLSVQTDIALPMLETAHESVKESHLRPAIAGEQVAAFAVTEAGGGSDPGNIHTSLTLTPRGLRVNGEKTWITNGTVADFLLVACRLNDAAALSDLAFVVVPADARGLSRHPVSAKLGNIACDHGIVSLDDIELSRSHLIGDPGDGYPLMTDTFVRERRFLAVAISARARQIITESIEWARTHRVHNSVLIEQQSVRFKLADLVNQLELIEAFIDRTSTAVPAAQLSLRDASVMKLRASQLAREASDVALQLRGARAYMSDRGPARDVRDMRAWALAGGSDHALMHLISGLLDINNDERTIRD